MISDQPFLFVIFALTADNEVLCVTDSKELVLPRYEFQPDNGKESKTDAIKRQMQEDTGYEPYQVNLTNYETQHTAKGRRLDTPFRTCLALGCVRFEDDQPPSTLSPFPWVQYGLEKNYSEKFESFEAWSVRKQAQREAKKNKITLIPFEKWQDMVRCGEITDILSVTTTEITNEWMAFEKQKK